MVDLTAYALDFIQTAGLLAIFVLLVLDGAMLLPVLPGEVVLIIAVAIWGDSPAGLALVFTVAVAAAIVGAWLLYGIGHWAAGNALRKRKSVLGMSPKRLDRMQHLFARPSGQFLLFLGRLFPLTRIIVSLPAGIARMPFWRFTFISIVGTALFYAAFLWVTYEFSREDSEIKATADGVQAAYATPAWEYIETNWIVSALIVLAIAVVLSVRAAKRKAHDPEETGGTLIGFAATAVLFWGGIALLVGLWLDRQLVYDTLALGGVHARGWHLGLPFEPESILIGAGALAVLLGIWLGNVRAEAKRRHMEKRKTHEKLAFQGRLKPAEVKRGRSRSAEPTPTPPAEWTETHRAGRHPDDRRQE